MTVKWLPGMLGVSLNDGTKYRILGEGEEPMRVDARLGQDLAEWPVQTGMNRLIPDLNDTVTRLCALELVRQRRCNPDWFPASPTDLLTAWRKIQ
jgi:hypothetical protein